MAWEDDRFAEIAPGRADFFIRHLNLEPHGKPRRIRPHQATDVLVRRDYYDLCIHVSGRSEVDVLESDGNIRTVDVQPGSIFHWRPQDYRYRAFRIHGPIELFEVGVRASAWLAFVSMLDISPERQTAPAAPVAAFDPRRDPIAGFFAELRDAAHGRASKEALIRFLVEIVPRLYSPAAAVGGRAPHWLASSIERMRDEENLRAGMPRLLELTHVGPRHLGRLTQRYFATTPHDIVADARLEHAMRLLRSGSESVSVIAERCGYGSASYFSYAFREATGTSPREFRNRGLRGYPGARATPSGRDAGS